MTALARPLRIAFVADTLSGDMGGGVVAGRRFVDELRRHHRVVTVGADAYGPDRVKLAGFVLPLRAMREMRFVMARPDREALGRAFAGVDVVHLQFPFWLSFVALEEARRAGRPVVAAFHVQPENALLNVGLRARWLAALLYRGFIGGLLERADAVVCPTRFAERKLRERGLRAPTYVVSNGAPAEPLPGAGGALAHRRPGPFLVLMVGRLAAEKRHEVLIEAVRRARRRDRIRLVIAGAGPREAEIRRLARGLPGGAEVGFLSRERLRALFGEADLLVHCSEVELEGLAVLEALHMGLPALVADGPETAAAELALSDDLRFPAGDVAALAARLDRLIDEPSHLAAARARCREAAGARSLDRSVQQLVGVYRTVLAAR